MKQLSKLWLVPFLILFAIPADAQLTDNTLGLYFDATADVQCAEGVTPFTMLTMYLVLSNPTMEEIFGFECGITQVGTGATFMTATHSCGISMDLVDMEQIQVGCSGLPCVEHTVLMSIDYWYTSTSWEMVLFYLHDAAYPTLPGGHPLIQLNDGSLLQVPVDRLASIDATAAMTGNFDICYPLSTDTHNWDSLKSLYR